MKRKLLLMILTLIASLSSALAQNTITVTGTVTAESDGQPIAGAYVLVNGTTIGTMTNTEGKFGIKNVPADAKEIIVTFLGMSTASAKVSTEHLNIVMHEDATYLNEVTVVAFGTKRKQDLVGSISTVKGSIIDNTQATSVSSALEGAVAGVQVLSASGQPGDDASIVVRGIGSLSASNTALIVVDGVPFNGKLSDLNPADIESIVVSKDAVSNSLYGSRAASGVVMVTTKKGSKEKLTIRVNGNWGVSSRAYKDYDMVTDPGEFYRLTWYGIRNTEWASGKELAEASLTASQTLLEELGNYNSYIIPEGEYLVNLDGTLNANAKLRYHDTFADAMFQNTFRQEYTASAAGGNDCTDYYVSLGWLDNKSYIVGSGYNRFTARANVNSQLKKWLKVGMNIGYSKSTQTGVNDATGKASNPFEVARSWAPIFPVHAYDAEGNMKYDANGKPMYDAGTGQTDGTVSRPVATNQNVICNLYEDIRKNDRHALNSKAYAEVRFLKNFTFTTNFSYDFANSAGVEYYTPTIGDGASFKGRGTHSSYNWSTLNTNQILAYENVFGENHNFSAKLGHEYYLFTDRYLAGQKTNFFDPTNPELSNGGALQDLTSNTNKHNIEGFFGVADYNYASRYYFSAAYRRDGTSRFIDRWGDFWSVGGAWRISAEPWMKNSSNWLNDLKIRASYGTQGNESILPGYDYAYTPYTDQYNITWDGSSLGYSYAYYGNPDLTWEKQKTFDAGVDFRFIDRIYGSVDWFYRRTDDMLFSRPLPESTGRPYNWENIGSMQNTGVEFEVNFDILKKKDLKWTVTLVGSHYDNKILTLPEENKAEGITSGLFNLREGKSRYEYYTYKYAGMTEKGQAMWYMDEIDQNTGEKTGNIITTEDYTKATKYFLDKEALPDFTGGLNMTFFWKGLDISVATAYQIGGWAYDSSFLSGMSASYYVGHNKELWNTFNPETSTGKYPIWNANNVSSSYTQTSDAHLVKASYLSIKNITIGYTFPKKWMQKLNIEGIRIYATADNCALWSARQGFDPRVSMSGSNSSFGGYSPLKVISGGVNFTF